MVTTHKLFLDLFSGQEQKMSNKKFIAFVLSHSFQTLFPSLVFVNLISPLVKTRTSNNDTQETKDCNK